MRCKHRQIGRDAGTAGRIKAGNGQYDRRGRNVRRHRWALLQAASVVKNRSQTTAEVKLSG